MFRYDKPKTESYLLNDLLQKKMCRASRMRILNLAGSVFTSAIEPELYITLTKMEGKEEYVVKHNPESFKFFRSFKRFTYV